MGKVIDINYPWYNKRVKVEYKNKVYLNCGWGNRYMEDKNPNFDGGIRPFADN